MSRNDYMHKKWGYILSATTTFTVVATLVFLVLEQSALALITIITATVLCFLWTVKYHFTYISNAQNIKYIKELNKRPPNRRSSHNDSDTIEGTIETNVDQDSQANVESATKTTASDIVDPHRDEESGLLSHSFFPVYLDQRITAARRTLRPVSLVIFVLDGLDKNDSNSPSDREFFISAVGDVVKRTLRESDCGFRIDENTFAAVMDDTSESGAVWAAERVRGVLHTGALAGRVTISAGVACYPTHALEPDELISRATKALKTARERGVDQVEIATE